MLTHVVVFTWKAGTTAEQVQAVSRGLERLASEIRDVLGLRHGADLRFRDGGGDYALIATFADEAAWRRYQDHPAHRAFVDEVVTPLRSGGISTQFVAGGGA